MTDYKTLVVVVEELMVALQLIQFGGSGGSGDHYRIHLLINNQRTAIVLNKYKQLVKDKRWLILHN